jgi:hypothetical protein
LSSNLNVAIGEIIRVKITIAGNFAGNAHAVQPEYDYKGNSNSICGVLKNIDGSEGLRL